MLTDLDEHNARIYTHNCALKYKYDQYSKSHPHIFSHVDYRERPATHDDYYVPPAIAHKCVVVSLEWKESGCRKISCYPFKENNEQCQPTDETRILTYGNSYTLACQPACYNLFPDDERVSEFDVKFGRDGKCVLVNSLVKQYAINPQSRSNFSPSLPYHLGLDVNEENEKLMLNEIYCSAHGMAFEDGDCVATTAQQVGEFFIGSTIYRSLNVLVGHKQPVVTLPSTAVVPKDISTTADWLEGLARVPRVQIQDPDFETPVVPVELAMDIAKDIAVDIGIDLTVHQISKFLKKTIPKKLLKLVGSSTLASVFASTQLFTSAAAAFRLAGSSLNVATGVLAVFQLVTMAVDLIDPCEFNMVLTRDKLDRVSNVLFERFAESIGYNDREITPEIIWKHIENESPVDEAFVLFIDSKLKEYVQSLTVTSRGQRRAIQENNYSKKRKTQRRSSWNFLNMHFLITMLFIALALMFARAIAYVAFGYLCFVAFINFHVANDFETVSDMFSLKK